MGYQQNYHSQTSIAAASFEEVKGRSVVYSYSVYSNSFRFAPAAHAISLSLPTMDFVEVSPSHEDLVHDIAFDFYGKRFATCSSDKHIKIWTLDEEKDTWTSYDIPRAHQNSIWRLSWANPEYGQLLASCSDDNTICLWEEQESTTVADSSQDRWKKVKLASHKRSVNDVKFCHRSLGLKLASACADGYLRIYEALDIFDINKWDLMVSVRFSLY